MNIKSIPLESGIDFVILYLYMPKILSPHLLRIRRGLAAWTNPTHKSMCGTNGNYTNPYRGFQYPVGRWGDLFSLAVLMLLVVFSLGQFWVGSTPKENDEFVTEDVSPAPIDTDEQELLRVIIPEEEPRRFAEKLSSSPPLKKEEVVRVIAPLQRFEYVGPPSSPLSTSTQVATTSAVVSSPVPSPKPSLPPLDEEAIFRAIVKIECPTKDGLGKYIGSGFVLKDRKVVTAAHVVEDSGKEECAVIFPLERRPIYFLRGTLLDIEGAKKRFHESGIDLAFIELPDLSQYSEGRAIFPEKYPIVPYPLCTAPQMLGDTTFHYGYPANFKDLNYLERLRGEAVEYADIEGVENGPIFSSTRDESRLHPYMVSRTGVFYGASGGLAFNETKQFILGLHHGFSSGSSESHSIFLVLGWEGAKNLLPF